MKNNPALNTWGSENSSRENDTSLTINHVEYNRRSIGTLVTCLGFLVAALGFFHPRIPIKNTGRLFSFHLQLCDLVGPNTDAIVLVSIEDYNRQLEQFTHNL